MSDLAHRMNTSPQTVVRPATLAELRHVYDDDSIAAMHDRDELAPATADEFAPTLVRLRATT